MSKELLRMEGITKIYPNGFIANKDITFSVNEGEIHALIGENGAGKTTLMKVLFGLEKAQEGSIYINGEKVEISSPLDAIDKGLGMVHQHFMQIPNFTVAENVALGMEPGKAGIFDNVEATRITKETVEKYKLDIESDLLIRNLTVGQKQKVELVKALSRGIKVLILDEPTAVLTPQETEELFVQLKLLRDMGYGIIFISHKLDEVMELCDRTTVLRRGRVTGQGSICDLSASKLATMMVEREVDLKIDKEKAKPLDTIVEVRNLNYLNKFGKQIISDLSFGVRAGEVVGVAGVEGNGQTELSEILAGMLPRTSGDILLNGFETNNASVDQIRNNGLAHISEDRMKFGIAGDLSIRDNIAPIFLKSGAFNVGPFIRTRKLNKFVENCIIDFEIACNSGNDNIRYLSGGNIQKVVLARELSSEANFIIANQPTRGIDIGTADKIRRTLVQHTRELARGVLLITSDLNELMEVSDRIVVMKNGKIVAQFTELDSVTDELMGEYMLGLKEMSEEEMGNLF